MREGAGGKSYAHAREAGILPFAVSSLYYMSYAYLAGRASGGWRLERGPEPKVRAQADARFSSTFRCGGAWFASMCLVLRQHARARRPEASE